MPEEPLLPPDATFRPDEEPAEAQASEPGPDDLSPADPPTEQAPTPESDEERPDERGEPKPPVTGELSDKQFLENTWGTGADTPISYHDDGPIGMAVKYMGADQRMSVDGEPLANVLGKLATDVNRGRRTPQEGLDAMKELRDRLPDDSRARSCLDSAIRDIDAPRGPAPVLPDGTPEPLRKLVQDLHDIPAVRAQPDREMEPLLRIIDTVASGQARPMMVEMEIDRIGDRRHESYVDSGWRQIQSAVQAAREGYLNHVRDQTRKQPGQT